MDDIEELFATVGGAKPWYATLSDEERAWIDEVVDRAKTKGHRPGTQKFCDAFERRFGRSVSAGTARKALRQLSGLS